MNLCAIYANHIKAYPVISYNKHIYIYIYIYSAGLMSGRAIDHRANVWSGCCPLCYYPIGRLPVGVTSSRLCPSVSFWSGYRPET